MKIKIKSREEIERTLNKASEHKTDTDCGVHDLMFFLCDKTLDAEWCYFSGATVKTIEGPCPDRGWFWHPDWYEIIEADFTDEELMDIELMDEMLNYFLDSKDDTDVTDDSIRIFIEELKQRHKSLLDTFKVHQMLLHDMASCWNYL